MTIHARAVRRKVRIKVGMDRFHTPGRDEARRRRRAPEIAKPLVSYSIRRPEIAREITTCWICWVRPKMAGGTNTRRPTPRVARRSSPFPVRRPAPLSPCRPGVSTHGFGSDDKANRSSAAARNSAVARHPGRSTTKQTDSESTNSSTWLTDRVSCRASLPHARRRRRVTRQGGIFDGESGGCKRARTDPRPVR